MTDENALRRQMERGFEAKRLMDHPIMADVIERLVRDAVAEFATVDPGDLHAFQSCQAKLKVAHDFKSIFRRVIKEGEDATALLKHQERTRG